MRYQGAARVIMGFCKYVFISPLSSGDAAHFAGGIINY